MWPLNYVQMVSNEAKVLLSEKLQIVLDKSENPQRKSQVCMLDTTKGPKLT